MVTLVCNTYKSTFGHQISGNQCTAISALSRTRICQSFEKACNILSTIINVFFLTAFKHAVPPEILARGPLAQQAYYHALDEGKICDRRVPLMLVGQDRSGKTSLKKSLKGIYFNSEEDSTVGIDFDPNPFKVTTEMWMIQIN